MSTYSTSLKLTLIGDGEQTGTWGQTTNTNLGTLLEEAIVGQTTIIMANADYTLTNLDGVSDEARNAVIIVTGNQNATYSVIVPAVEKLYMVTNNTATLTTVYIKPSGGSTTQVPYGRTMYLYCTGTAFVALDYVQYAQSIVSGGSITTGAINCASLTSSGAIVGTTVNGTTITASTQFSGPGTGLTGTASSLTAGNVNGIVAVVNGGTGVTTSTGTGSVVLSSSPTLVTPLLGTPTSGNLANCTGYPSGSISGNINLATQVTGTLAVTNGGTGVATSTGTGSVVLSASPTLTGSPIAPTQTAGDNSTKIATTAYVATAVTNATSSLGTMSTQNANNVAITGGTINGVSGTNASLTVGNATNATNVTGGTVNATSVAASTGTFTNQVSATSPNSGSAGGLQIRDAVGNPDAVYLQGTNNAGSAQYATIKLNANGTITPSGNVIGNITGNAVTATNTIGNGQTWQNLSGSRSISTTYTNSTGKPIQVNIMVSRSGGNDVNMDAFLYTDAGLTDNQGIYVRDGGNWAISVSAIIPIGGNYSASWNNAGTVIWMELR